MTIKFSLTLLLGICCFPNIIFSEEGDRYDFNKSTTTVNRSSDIREHRTMDSRPEEFDDGNHRYDFNKSTTTVNHSSDIRESRTMDSRPADY